MNALLCGSKADCEQGTMQLPFITGNTDCVYDDSSICKLESKIANKALSLKETF